MLTNTLIVLTTGMAVFSAVALLRQLPSFATNLDGYGVPRSWWPWLAGAKLVGGIGVLAGLRWPWVGALAAAGLAIYFLGALITVLRAGAVSHVIVPLAYFAPPMAVCLLLTAS